MPNSLERRTVLGFSWIARGRWVSCRRRISRMLSTLPNLFQRDASRFWVYCVAERTLTPLLNSLDLLAELAVLMNRSMKSTENAEKPPSSSERCCRCRRFPARHSPRRNIHSSTVVEGCRRRLYSLLHAVEAKCVIIRATDPLVSYAVDAIGASPTEIF